MNLEPLFNKYECDKSKKHMYHIFYNQLFERLWEPREEHREGPLRILEIGVFAGHSALAFMEAMPGIEYVGVDIFERLPIAAIDKKLKGAFPNTSIELYKCDSMNLGKVRQTMSKKHKFDVIIDDGAHWPKANLDTMKNFWPYLAEGGTYVVEDVWPFHRMTTAEMQHPWLLKHPDRYTWFQWSHYDTHVESLCREGCVLNEHDFRKMTGEPDSYIHEIIKA